MTQRELRTLRQRKQGDRIVVAALISEDSRAKDRFLARFGITPSELSDLYTGRVRGAELDERVQTRRTNRRNAARIAGNTTPQWRQRERVQDAAALVDGELASLVAEQQRDDQYSLPARRWLISLDAPWGGHDSREDHYERGGLEVLVARRRGDFSTEAPWVPPLIDRIDRERERLVA